MIYTSLNPPSVAPRQHSTYSIRGSAPKIVWQVRASPSPLSRTSPRSALLLRLLCRLLHLLLHPLLPQFLHRRHPLLRQALRFRDRLSHPDHRGHPEFLRLSPPSQVRHLQPVPRGHLHPKYFLLGQWGLQKNHLRSRPRRGYRALYKSRWNATEAHALRRQRKDAYRTSNVLWDGCACAVHAAFPPAVTRASTGRKCVMTETLWMATDVRRIA